MTISYHEEISLTCSSCTALFRVEAWLILDAHEQPEQVVLLGQGYLNSYVCPQCGQAGSVRVPLLFHDGEAQVLIFAPAAGQSEHAWRDQVRELHMLLIESIPEDTRRAYLADVQIAQDIDGIAHILRKRSRRAQPTQNPGWIDLATSSHANARPNSIPSARESVESKPGSVEHTSHDDATRLLAVVQQLIAADTLETFYALVQQYPALLGSAVDFTLKDMADLAVDQRQYDLAEGMRQVRLLLADLRAGGSGERVLHPAPPDQSVAPVPADAEEIPPVAAELPDQVCQTLLRVQSSQDLLQVVQNNAILLEEWVDAALSYQINHALEEGNERLAHALEIRREALAILRESLDVQNGDMGLDGG